jgi:dTDP-4-amino-4,6-dideoxygalactose transaminase
MNSTGATSAQAAAAGVTAAVPLFELATQYQQIRNEIEAAVKEVLDTQNYCSGAASGPFVGRFEEHLGTRLGGRVVGVSSGTDALLAAVMALGIEPGSDAEVITTPFTFFATAGSIRRAGARPVFVDIDPDTFLLNLDAVAAAVGPRTRAIMPVHLFGQMADTQRLAEIAGCAAGGGGVKVIEDAAQAIGARDRQGQQIGANAWASCLSFYPTKNLGAAGDAGALVTRDAALAQHFFQMRQHGEVSRYHHAFVGGNFRMDALQAAVLDVKLRYLDQWTARRQAHAAYYTSRFAGTDVIAPKTAPGIASGVGGGHVYHQYVVRVPRRDEVRDCLQKHQVGCNIFYPKCLHQQACFADLGYAAGAFPNAERATAEVLALPIYPELTEGQLQRVADVLLGFFR